MYAWLMTQLILLQSKLLSVQNIVFCSYNERNAISLVLKDCVFLVLVWYEV